MGRITAIICEFNPLHKGHKYILDVARENSDIVIAVMSGNFTERSEAAVFDKYKRATVAVKAGADIVFELPFPWCAGGAETFALGGVSVATGIGADTLIFGSECGDTELLKMCAKMTDGDSFSEIMKNNAGKEDGAAVVYDRVMRQYGIIPGGNDKLGIQYIKAAHNIGAELNFITKKRQTGNGYVTSTEIRNLLFDGKDIGNFVSEDLTEVYGKETDIIPTALEKLEYTFFRAFFREGELYAEGGGGVTERLVSAAKQSAQPEEFYLNAQTKKYTNSRLRRAALYSMLRVERDALADSPGFTVLLGANERGREYLSWLRYEDGLPIITKPSSATLTGKAIEQYELLCRADEIYSLCKREGCRYGEYLRRGPSIFNGGEFVALPTKRLR